MDGPLKYTNKRRTNDELLRGLDTYDSLSAISAKGDNFSAYQASCTKASTQQGKNLLPLGANSFLVFFLPLGANSFLVFFLPLGANSFLVE